MKWTPQALVAVMLGGFILVIVLFEFIVILSGKGTATIEDDKIWVDLLKTAVGGLLVYIGANARGKDD